MLARFALAFLAATVACVAAAQQQLYRWTDEKGRTHITDTPPPANAKGVRKVTPAAPAGAAAKPPAAGLERPMKEFPVTLYTAPNCTDPCAAARDLLNKRGVPFTETPVFDEDGVAALKKLSGSDNVPALKVGTSVWSGFQKAAYDSLLDSAGYPRAGVLPARAQAAPPPPEGYGTNPEPPKAEPLKPEASGPSGPYAPGAAPPRRTPSK
jgi:glutaredoxin